MCLIQRLAAQSQQMAAAPLSPGSYGHKTTSHGMKGLNVCWQWQDFGGTLKLSEASALYCCSVTVPCLVLWFVTTLWGIYWGGNSYFPSTSLLKTIVWSWQNQRVMIFCGPKSLQRFRHQHSLNKCERKICLICFDAVEFDGRDFISVFLCSVFT